MKITIGESVRASPRSRVSVRLLLSEAKWLEDISARFNRRLRLALDYCMCERLALAATSSGNYWLRNTPQF